MDSMYVWQDFTLDFYLSLFKQRDGNPTTNVSRFILFYEKNVI